MVMGQNKNTSSSTSRIPTTIKSSTSSSTSRILTTIKSNYPCTEFGISISLIVIALIIYFVIRFRRLNFRFILAHWKFRNRSESYEFSLEDSITPGTSNPTEFIEMLEIIPNKKKEVTTNSIEVLPSIEPKKKNYFIHKDGYQDFMAYNRSKENALLIAEYKNLNVEAKSMTKRLGLTTKTGCLENNVHKNRYTNIVAFDQTRIKLANCKPTMNYINANSVPFIDHPKEMEYLACQGPTDDSVDDFIQMIWEQSVNCIIMLTGIEENGKNKCLKYWPDENSDSYTFDNFEMILDSESFNDSFIERKLLLINKPLKATRSIFKLQMHTWNDHSAPDPKHFDNLLYRFQELTITSISAPYLVHCSAGVGRTGTFIALDRLTRELMNGSEEISIYNTVLHLRKSRTMMVQRANQYIFIHEYLDHFLQASVDTKKTEDMYCNG